MRALLLALQLVTLPAPQSAPPGEAAERTWAQAERAIRAFQREWADAWGATQLGKNPPIDFEAPIETRPPFAVLREVAVHCHWPPGIMDRARYASLLTKVAVTNTLSAQSACSMWYPLDARRLQDERLALDGGLAPEFRPAIRQRRAELNRLLEAAAQSSPNDLRLTGQRVRFALDGWDLDGAMAIADSCHADAVLCQLLKGLARYRNEQVAAADSLFLAAASGMTAGERCAWNDVGVLLDKELRASYAALSCAERGELEERLWWLADPLYHEPGNERRAEHFARKVSVGLLAQFPGDGRQHFERRKGGEAVIETLIRYGWPAHVYWAGSDTDKSHYGCLFFRAAAAAAPYVLREYTRGRLHTLPPAAVLAAPFAASSEQWQLNDPGEELHWWPTEHFARDRSRIVELGRGQSGLLRREAATRFVWAGTLDSAQLGRRSGESVRAALFAWRSPSEGWGGSAYSAQTGGRLLVDAALHPGPTLIGIEIAGDRAVPAARTRFGTRVTDPLAALTPGARALSEPLLVEPAADAESRMHADEAVRRMYPTTTLPRQDLIGVYWEGYGFAATDTIDVELRVTREDRPGILARMAGAVGVVQDPSAGTALRWRDEPGSARAVQVLEGATPVQMRNVTVNLANLASGSYRLTISMTTPRAGTASSDRTFVLR